MSESASKWKKAAAEAASYRRMYALANEIVCSQTATRELRSAARRVIRILRDVIDLPVADSAVLAKARRRFRELMARLGQFSDV